MSDTSLVLGLASMHHLSLLLQHQGLVTPCQPGVIHKILQRLRGVDGGRFHIGERNDAFDVKGRETPPIVDILGVIPCPSPMCILAHFSPEENRERDWSSQV